MLMCMLRFELCYHFKQLTFLLAAFLFCFMGGFSAVQGGFSGAEVHKNAPYVITSIMALFSLMGIFTATLFGANVVLRDSVYKMEPVILTSPVQRKVYFTVRFLGLVISVFSLMVFTLLGIYIGSFLAGGAETGPFHIIYFLQPLFVFGLANVLFASSLVFCTALLTKNVRAVYATGVLLYILYMVASILGNSPLLATSALVVKEQSILPFLADPFGLASFFSETRYWSGAQKNNQLLPIQGTFLINRLLWLGVSTLIVGLSYHFFDFRLQAAKRSSKPKKEQPYTPIPFKAFKVFPRGFKYHLAVLRVQFKSEVSALFGHVPFMVMLLLWVFLFGVELKDAILHGPYGIKYYPTTAAILEEIRSMKFGLVLVVFYAAEVVGRERSANIQSLIYSTPVKSSVLWASKCLTLALMVLILVSLNICIGIALQISQGYFVFDLPAYFSLYYYSAFPFFLYIILLVFVQNLSVHKYLGMLFSLMVTFAVLFANRLGIEHYLLRYAAVPELQFSAFNQFGHYATAFNWYMLYWSGFAGMLAVLTIGMWQNNTLSKYLYKSRFLFFAAAILWAGSGVYIYRQSNIIGSYKNKKEQLDSRIDYEKKYKALSALPQPIIKSIKMAVDLFPEQRKYHVNGSYCLKNESGQPISRLWVSMHPQVNDFEVSLQGVQKQLVEPIYKQLFIDLKSPLLPGQELPMSFSFEVIRSGFVPFDTENSVVRNGSYIEMEKFVPQFGYREGLEIQDERERKSARLTPRIIVSPTDRHHHLIDLETTISTSAEQQVVTVGTLQQSWLSGKRRYFKYKTEAPINFMFALSAAQYVLKTENYKGTDLRFYYLKGQEYNIQTMLKAIKDALDYGSANFSTYPLKHFTLAEIPHYRGAATAYPGVVFSAERINFLTDYRNSKLPVNQSYAITAHEVAHQWWANVLSPVEGPGANLLTESLAKYTEAVLIEKMLGKMALSSYLKQDNQLYFALQNPNEKELPLAEAYAQNHVHYQKGGLVFYAVKEVLGEKVFTSLLNKFIKQHASPNLKATAGEFVKFLLTHTPLKQKRFIEESFNQVVTYQLAVKVLSCEALADGKFKLNLEVNTGLTSTSDPQTHPVDMDIDLAVFDVSKTNWTKNTKPFYLQKHRFNQLKTKLCLVLEQKPASVAIDPYGYLLDANLSDHIQEVILSKRLSRDEFIFQLLKH
ncbi:ABC-type transport system involved in multi-copper enzyme maturation permease subunit [Pedobacter nutrimenti]|uniref:ABC-type transport system involved in multi-copper enzyme maturation permease subunit n=2 Tax=Pedobacter nutrimenti TaxID=1241337 RepID=A0A318UM08_9SPHI|nr:ABC-type transport system involved in multi-copper enzyme maturation permease subunit [Pedobacter nutrimenti]